MERNYQEMMFGSHSSAFVNAKPTGSRAVILDLGLV